VMERGKVVDTGTFAELRDRSDYFRVAQEKGS
jgi:hypothetical protein